MTNHQLIKQAADGDNLSFNQVKDQYAPLCHKIVSNYSTALTNSGVFLPDIQADIPLIIYESAKKYDPTMNTEFSTFVSSNVKFHCLEKMRKTIRESTKHSKFDFFNTAPVDPEDNSFEDIISELRGLDYYIVKAKFLEGDKTTYADLGKIFNLTGSRIEQIYKKALKKLRNNLKKD